MSFANTYDRFLARALGLSPRATYSSRGAYVRRHHQKFIFVLYDFRRGKLAVTAHPKWLSNLDRVRVSHAFDDLDLGLTKRRDFKPARLAQGLRITRLTRRDKAKIDKFNSTCSSKDLATLDLRFENEFAVALWREDRIVGIARAARIRGIAKLVDVTVLITPRERGEGLSAPLVSALVDRALKRGFWPKYRVAADNLPSIAIARRLGFSYFARLLTLRAKSR